VNSFYLKSDPIKYADDISDEEIARSRPAIEKYQKQSFLALEEPSACEKRNYPETRYVPLDLHSREPYKYVGKVIINGNYHCSGSVVGGNVVMTAGHCGFTKSGFPASFTFIPQNSVTGKPFGQWKGYQQYATKGWASGNWNEDFMFVVMYKKDGKTLQEALGGSFKPDTCDYNQKPIHLIGYPVTGHCVNCSIKCDGGGRMAETVSVLERITGKICAKTTMGQGASGGPWIRTGTNTQCGVTSTGLEILPANISYRLVTPPITSLIMDLYKTAMQAIPPDQP